MQDPLAGNGVHPQALHRRSPAVSRPPAAARPESRHSRFGGGVSDEFIRNYVGTTFGLSAIVHGFFVDGVLRGAAELRPLGPTFAREAEAALSIEQPWQSHGVEVPRCSTARCSLRGTAASRRCTWPASPTTAACRSWRGSSPRN